MSSQRPMTHFFFKITDFCPIFLQIQWVLEGFNSFQLRIFTREVTSKKFSKDFIFHVLRNTLIMADYEIIHIINLYIIHFWAFMNMHYSNINLFYHYRCMLSMTDCRHFVRPQVTPKRNSFYEIYHKHSFEKNFQKLNGRKSLWHISFTIRDLYHLLSNGNFTIIYKIHFDTSRKTELICQVHAKLLNSPENENITPEDHRELATDISTPKEIIRLNALHGDPFSSTGEVTCFADTIFRHHTYTDLFKVVLKKNKLVTIYPISYDRMLEQHEDAFSN